MPQDERDVRFAAQSMYQNMYRPYPPIDFCKFISCSWLNHSHTIEYFYRNSTISVAFNKFHHRRFPSWIHGRWSSNVSGSTVFLSLCNIRFIFYFFALVDLHIGELIAIKILGLNESMLPFQITGDNIYNALKTQIIHYSIYASLFDIVMAAVCRFTVLILFYALLYINHWSVIAVSCQ